MKKSMEEVLLAVAPVSAQEIHNDPEKIAGDVIKCAKAGAGMVHLHMRDESNKLTDHPENLQKTINLIRKESDIIIEVSTGGVSDLTIQQRCKPLSCQYAECASLNVGSVNLGEAVYMNPIADVRYCLGEILKTKKIPEVEIFELGMINVILKLQKEFNIPLPMLLNIVLGHEGAAPATIDTLYVMRHFIPQDMLWGITHYGRESNDILTCAIEMGAFLVRLGYEDSKYISDNKYADSNEDIIKYYVELLGVLGKKAMSAESARAILSGASQNK